MRIFNLSSLYVVCALLLSACGQQPEDSLQIQINDAWIREAPPGASAMAGYMRITNNSGNNIILHNVSSPAFEAIEFHRSIEKDGVYVMEPHLHLHIAANATIELKPGDYHLMMFNPTSALKQGDTAKIELFFSDEQVINATIPVKKAQY
jgi:periplasmic copper chaperone A